MVGCERDEYNRKPTKCFLLHKDTNGIIVGTVLIDGYTVKSDNNDSWEDIWEQCGGDVKVLNSTHYFNSIL